MHAMLLRPMSPGPVEASACQHAALVEILVSLRPTKWGHFGDFWKVPQSSLIES